MEPLLPEVVIQEGDQAHQNADMLCKYPRSRHGSDCSQLESAVEVLPDDILDDKSEIDEENTPEKEIIQSNFYELKIIKQSESDNDSSLGYGMQASACESEKLSDGLEKNMIVQHFDVSEHDRRQAKAVSAMWPESKTDSNLVKMLWRQIGSLAMREQEVERTLSKERIENLVSKVEEEVEFEGMVEDMCLQFKVGGEFMDIERRERDWERERREVRLEEEVEILRNKVEALEEEIKVAHAERDRALQKQPLEAHELLCNEETGQGQQNQNSGDFERDEQNILTVVKAKHHELPDVGDEVILAALREMLGQVEEKAERDYSALEDTFQEEQKMWIETEQKLQSQASSLEKELNGLKDTLKEKESVISLERERRRQYGMEVDKVLAFWREENMMHKGFQQKLQKIEATLSNIQEKIKHLMTLVPGGLREVEGLLTGILEDLENMEEKKLEMCSPSSGQELFERELVEKWKAQRDLLEEERDKLQEQLDLATEKVRDNEERMEKLWQEREVHLVKQLRSLEAHAVNDNEVWNQVNTTASGDKEMWECGVSAYKLAWKEERDKVQALIVEKEQFMQEHTQEWAAAIVEAKEKELFVFRSTYKKLLKSLTTSKKRLHNLKRQLVKHRKGIMKESDKKQKLSSSNEDSGGPCSDEIDVDKSCSTDLSSFIDGSRASHGDEEYHLDAEQLAIDISKEIGRLAREMRQEQDRLEQERINVKSGTQQLKDERKELESKVADALNIMEDLREQMKAKEGQMERERKQMDQILRSKTDETDKLKAVLSSKEQEMDRSVQKFKDEICLIQKEVERERKGREDVMDMHFASRRKLIQELKEKEARWEREMEAMSEETEQLRKERDEKNQLISKLKRNSRNSELEKSFDDDIPNDVSDENLTLIKYVRTGLELSDLEGTQGSNSQSRRAVEWQDVIGKIAGFDKQIAEAMVAIQSLKEELNAKEKELQRARLERDAERKVAWVNAQAQTKEVQDASMAMDLQREFDCGEREQALLKDNEELIKLLEVERADTADAMSILQGAVQELQWALKHYKGKEDLPSFELDRKTQTFSIKGELIKVHASHLEELDQYILDLKLKVEEAEKRARTAEVALAVNAAKEAAKGTDTASALVKVGKEWVDNDRQRERDEPFPAIMGRGWGGNDIGSPYFHSPTRKQSNMGRRMSDVGPSPRNLQQDHRWSGGVTEHAQLWDVGISSVGMDASSHSSSSSGWMTARGVADDSFVMQDPFRQIPLTLAISTPPPRSQRRWLVDASWLENVRKEQTMLKQQLEIERQRVSGLKQVEADNRWMEAAIIQAIEQKKDSDTRVMELERKVSFLESMISKRGGREKSPTSDPYYRSSKT